MITMDAAYAWLHQFPEDQGRLSCSASLLVKELYTAVDQGQDAEVRKIIAHLKSRSQKSDSVAEVGEILLECGRAAYRLDDWEQAANLLKRAAEHYCTRPHAHAVALWMHGEALRARPDQQAAGIAAWQDSISIFNECAGKRPVNSQTKAWYQARVQEMTETIETVLKGEVQVPGSPASAASTADSAPQAGKASAASTSGAASTGATSAGGASGVGVANRLQPTSPKAAEDSLCLFVIKEEIPAGGFGPSGADPFPIAYAEVEQLKIEDRSYRVVSLKQGRLVNVLTSKDYVIIKVKGDSMNLAGIDDGDYVLLRQQSTADHSDIVAAEIVGEDTRATLKKFERHEASFVLQPCSNNPAHQPFVFKAPGHGVAIRGVAVAVLKPV